MCFGYKFAWKYLMYFHRQKLASNILNLFDIKLSLKYFARNRAFINKASIESRNKLLSCLIFYKIIGHMNDNSSYYLISTEISLIFTKYIKIYRIPYKKKLVVFLWIKFFKKYWITIVNFNLIFSLII